MTPGGIIGMSNDNSKLIKDSRIFKLQAASNCRARGTHITFKRLENGKSVDVQDSSHMHRMEKLEFL